MKRALTGAAAALLVATAPTMRSSDAAAAPKPETLEVFAAASLTEAVAELGALLQAKHPGLAIRFNLAGSQQLATQVEQGARADVFASADERGMRRLSEAGLLASAPRTFAENRLVVVVPFANPGRIERLQDLARPGVKLVLGADAVPVGRYARRVLANLAQDTSAFGPGFAARALSNLVSEEENVKSVLAKVRLGEADAGLVYASDVTPSLALSVRVLDVPDSANVPARYPVAILKGAKAPKAARAFVALLFSPEGRAVLARHGFAPPGDRAR